MTIIRHIVHRLRQLHGNIRCPNAFNTRHHTCCHTIYGNAVGVLFVKFIFSLIIDFERIFKFNIGQRLWRIIEDEPNVDRNVHI